VCCYLQEKDIPHEETPQQHPTPSKRTLEIAADAVNAKEIEKEDESETGAPVPATKRPVPPQRKSMSKQSDVANEAIETTSTRDIPQQKPALPKTRPNLPSKSQIHDEAKNKLIKHEDEHKHEETGETLDDEDPAKPEKPKRQPLPRPPPPTVH
jgi:hypothetical protein